MAIHAVLLCELVAVNERLAQILWTRLFMKAQGIKVSNNILYRDNKSVKIHIFFGICSSSKEALLFFVIVALFLRFSIGLSQIGGFLTFLNHLKYLKWTIARGNKEESDIRP